MSPAAASDPEEEMQVAKQFAAARDQHWQMKGQGPTNNGPMPA